MKNYPSYTIPMSLEEVLNLVRKIIAQNGLSKKTTIEINDEKATLKVNKFGTSKITLWYKELNNKTMFGILNKNIAFLHQNSWDKFENTLTKIVSTHGGSIH